MTRKALPIKMLKKGELEKIAGNSVAQKTVAPLEKMVEPKLPETKPQPKDFRHYLNVYNFQCELPGTGEVIDFTPLTVTHLKEIQTMDPGVDAEKKQEDPIFLSKVFDKIFESVITSDFDTNSMYINDRFTLILEIRKKLLAHIFRIFYVCNINEPIIQTI